MDKDEFISTLRAKIEAGEGVASRVTSGGIRASKRFAWKRSAWKRPAWRKSAWVAAPFVLLAGAVFTLPVAEALQNIPVVNLVMNMVHGTPASRFVTKIHQPVTDRGITVTITDVLYDHGHLDVGYTVTPRQPNQQGVFALGPVDGGMQFFIDGKPLSAQAGGEQSETSYGYNGTVSIFPNESLPDHFDLQISISKVGHKWGDWSFTIPVSRKQIDAATHTFLPGTKATVGQTHITVTRVEVGPATTEIDYRVTNPSKQKVSYDFYPGFVNVLDDHGHMLQGLTGGPLGNPTVTGDTVSSMYRALFRSAGFPKYLTLLPEKRLNGTGQPIVFPPGQAPTVRIDLQHKQ